MIFAESETDFDETAKPKIILAVADEKRKAAYLSAFGSTAELILTETLREIPALLRKTPCNGILIDILLKVRASHMDGIRISDSLEAMPSATLTLDGKNGSVRILMLNRKHGAAGSVAEFTRLCAEFHAADIYPDDFSPLNLNALISTSPEFGDDSERTCTTFVSGSGCFLFTASAERYVRQSVVWIDFVGLAERRPIMAKVRWNCPWGVSHRVPGIYVDFESILESQFEEITSLLAILRNKT